MPKGAPIVVWGEKYFLFLNILFFFSHVHLRLISLRGAPQFWTDPPSRLEKSQTCPYCRQECGFSRQLVKGVKGNEALRGPPAPTPKNPPVRDKREFF